MHGPIHILDMLGTATKPILSVSLAYSGPG